MLSMSEKPELGSLDQTTLTEVLLSACQRTLPYQLHFSIEGTLKLILDDKDIILCNINQTVDKNTRFRSVINENIQPGRRGRPRKHAKSKPKGVSINHGGQHDNNTHEEVQESLPIADMGGNAQHSRRSSGKISECGERVNIKAVSEDEGVNQEGEGGVKDGGQTNHHVHQPPLIQPQNAHQHSYENQNGQFACSVCFKIFETEHCLQNHVATHINDRVCKHGCNEPCSDKITLKMHKNFNFHSSENENISNKKRRIPKKDFKVNCHVCDQLFHSTMTMEAHVKKKHPGIKPYKCKFCEKTFSQNGSRNIHERRHTGERPYECQLCGKKFVDTGHLKKHEMIHTGEKKYKCPFCDKRFIVNSTLKAHVTLHTGEQKYVCSFCGKKYGTKGNLKVHEKSHSGEMPFQCDFCEKRFNCLGGCKRHEQTHTGERPFQCGFCGQCFMQKTPLVEHERIHTGEKPFQCQFCDKMFSRKMSRAVHEKAIHLGETPYTCSYCDRKFTRLKGKKDHEKTHTGEKPHQCHVCGAAFALSSNLKRHKKSLHEDKLESMYHISNLSEQF